MSTSSERQEARGGAAVEGRLDHLAIEFSEKSYELIGNDKPALADLSRSELEGHIRELHQFLRDHAYSLSGFAQQIRDEYVRMEDREEDRVTPAQGVSLADSMCGSLRSGISAFVTLGGQGLSDKYLLVQYSDGFTCGIDREGRRSS